VGQALQTTVLIKLELMILQTLLHPICRRRRKDSPPPAFNDSSVQVITVQEVYELLSGNPIFKCLFRLTFLLQITGKKTQTFHCIFQSWDLLELDSWVSI